jgi:peptidoglycan-associated lipoprotein
MKIQIIPLVLCLTACSTVSLKDVSKGSNENNDAPPIVENRTKKNNSGVTVEVDTDARIEVRKIDIPKRNDPNGIFRDYLIYFDLDEYTVQDKFLPLLKQHAEFLVKNPDEFVFIEGHTDERGGAEYNLALGQRRANAVKVVLMNYGVSEKQAEAFSYGSEKPRIIGSNEEAWSENRRVELYYRN